MGKSHSLTASAAPISTQGRVRAGVAACLLVAALGLGLVYLAGFAGAEALHAAAHDSRHSLSFPCH